MNRVSLILLIFICALFGKVFGQTPINYDEAKIAPYTLPELLTLRSGVKVETVEQWEQIRRKEILNLYFNEVFGYMPNRELKTSVVLLERSKSALDNKAERRQYAITFEKEGKKLTVNVLIYKPKSVENPHFFIGYNFLGNHTVLNDDKIILSKSWFPNSEVSMVTENRATEEARGVRTSRWQVEELISNGFGLVTMYYGDIDPDRNDFSDGLHPLFYKDGQSKPNINEWGSISAWAWGLSSVMDFLKRDSEYKNSKFIAFGHSRLGKTALWAGALDTRFDIVISNNSGCGGAALFRRKFGETIEVINKNFPHWFNDNFNKYDGEEDALPIDQHMLIALMAPRPVYIASAEEDKWADPKGEYLSGFYASPVYELYEKEELSNTQFPEVNSPIFTSIGYHMRTGKHNVTSYDWEQYMRFAKMHLD